MPARTISVAGFKVRPPKHGMSADVMRQRISRMASDMAARGKRPSSSEACTIIFFKGQPVQRCENRDAKAAWRASGKRTRAKLQRAGCIGKKGKIKRGRCTR